MIILKEVKFEELTNFYREVTAHFPDKRTGNNKSYSMTDAALGALNLLAFLFHTVLEFTDKKYRILRENLSRRITFFDHIRSLTTYLFFKSWDDLLNFMILKRGLTELINTS